MAPRKAKAPVAEELNQNRDVDGAKRAVLDKAVGDILKRFGEGSIMPLGQAHGMVTESFPTGSLSLDIALGVGGVPRGRITEIYGPESSGKTTICQHIVAEAQRMGGTAAFTDMEHALDPVYAARVLSAGGGCTLMIPSAGDGNLGSWMGVRAAHLQHDGRTSWRGGATRLRVKPTAQPAPRSTPTG